MIAKKYACLMRPPGPGAVPNDGLRQVGFVSGTAPSGHHAWGFVYYTRELTDEEMDHYDLEYVQDMEFDEYLTD